MTAGPEPELARSRELLDDEIVVLVAQTARLIAGPGTAIAEDAAQEAIVAVWQAAGRLGSRPDAPRAWASKIAARAAIRAVRRERRRSFFGARRELGDDLVARSLPAAEIVMLKDAFARLPSGQRAVAVLRLFVGLDERSTAETLGCSVGTVKSQLHDARRALRRSLGEPAIAEPAIDRDEAGAADAAY